MDVKASLAMIFDQERTMGISPIRLRHIHMCVSKQSIQHTLIVSLPATHFCLLSILDRIIHQSLSSSTSQASHRYLPSFTQTEAFTQS
mmetsp:Transcript_29210/g.33482  ORF Transcript_29210/g.33482 Transcript_29210/m.33482 type:complete len:88 (-) Transcript_29210:48-311(-)